jgi:hypothetical protein
MTYKVTLGSNSYSIKQSSPSKKYKVSTRFLMPQKLSELSDVNITEPPINAYVLSYDSATQKWRDINPDQVLSNAATEPVSPGIPDDFESALEIPFDAGTF